VEVLVKLSDDVLVEFCNHFCPNRKVKELYQKYGRLCPDCQVEAYHYWLLGRAYENANG